jgi:adenine-specific DNA-methyltransferase
MSRKPPAGLPQTPPVHLAYAGKAGRSEVLAGNGKPATLRIAGEWGEMRTGDWANRLIHADNLDALHALRRYGDVAGKVTLAYLDPPFATAQVFRAGASRTATVSASRSDAVAYDDRLTSAAYLEFLRQRLMLLRELLADDGSVYVHIGSQMAHYVRVLLDEVFDARNFLSEITRVKCNPKNFRRRAYGNIKDTLLFYSKTGRHVWNESRQPMTEADIARLFPRVDATGRRYTTTPLHAPGETRSGLTGAAWRGLRPPAGRHWRVSPAELTRLDRAGEIEWSSAGNPRKKIYADEKARSGRRRQDVWTTFKDPQYPGYPTEKNLAMLEAIVLASSNPGDLVLDCFAGSGTTLIAAEKHARRWIGIDSSPMAIRTARQRLQKTGACRGFTLLRHG